MELLLRSGKGTRVRLGVFLVVDLHLRELTRSSGHRFCQSIFEVSEFSVDCRFHPMCMGMSTDFAIITVGGNEPILHGEVSPRYIPQL